LMKDDDVVDTIKEFRLEMFVQHLQ
jgi:hypothetical protein